MGVVAYQLLTGLLPFQAVVRSRAADLPPPSRLNPSVPMAVDAVIERAMEIEPSMRDSTARAFAGALNEAFMSPPISDMPTVHDLAGSANVIVRTIIPENPCALCGQANRSGSRFCRHCGHNLDDAGVYVSTLRRRSVLQPFAVAVRAPQGKSGGTRPRRETVPGSLTFFDRKDAEMR
jgi:serine/threonine protein kinase